MPAKFNLPGRVCAKDAAKAHGLDPHSLCRAIDEGIVRGEKIVLGEGGRTLRHVDPAELEEDLATLPLCAYCGEKPAIAPSGACCGPHARALETRGTKLSTETRRKMSKSQTARHRRADEELERLKAAGFLNLRQVAEELHVAPNTVSRWVAEGFLKADLHVVELEHLLIVNRDELKRFKAEEWPRILRHMGYRRLPHFSPLSHRRWAGRQNGAKGAQEPTYTEEQARLVRDLKKKFPTLGRATIASKVSAITGEPLTEKQARSILAKPLT